ncbi:Uncharacterised protein [Candidatus Tiddalikarchaeum anstoanum]|nr:Uncharacterised protein [Candidatus Tiddalikarchaeum anstoanum]
MIFKTVNNVGWRKFLLWSISIGVLFLVLDMAAAIITMPIMNSYVSLPVWKVPVDSTAGIIFDIINGFILVSDLLLLRKGFLAKAGRKG